MLPWMSPQGQPRVPPGQVVRDEMRVKHYGPIPKAENAAGWSMSFGGSTAAGAAHELTVAELDELPQTRVVADFHCAGKWTVLDNSWEGVRAAEIVKRFPPADDAIGVLVYAQYGYSANVTVRDLVEHDAVLATRLNGEPLPAQHGFPVRLVVPHLYSWKSPKWFRGWEYLTEVRRGFWEERGYHLRGDPWREERYSYMERHTDRLS
jgi:DMSO/TMAO reductase YedYZ molybdopterin-dependent catalytic subunit